MASDWMAADQIKNMVPKTGFVLYSDICQSTSARQPGSGRSYSVSRILYPGTTGANRGAQIAIRVTPRLTAYRVISKKIST